VHPEHQAKTVSAETTFDRDASRAEELLPTLRLLSEKVSRRLKEGETAGQTVVLKLKDSGFRLRTRNRRLDEPTNLADQIYKTGRDLLLKELGGTSFRLIGIGVGGLGPAAQARLATQADLMDDGAEKRARAEGAMDKIRARYGNDGLALGLTFAAKEARRKPSA
jgi:DNA polymerase-4